MTLTAVAGASVVEKALASSSQVPNWKSDDVTDTGVSSFGKYLAATCIPSAMAASRSGS